MNGKAVLVVAALLLAVPALTEAQESEDSWTLMMTSGDGLRAQGMDYMVHQIDFFGRDGARATTRFHRKEFRWVRNDQRRGARGKGLTYMIDERGLEGRGISPAGAMAAIDRAAATWSRDSCMTGSHLARTGWTGEDNTVFDFVLEVGPFGNPFVADIVVAGMAPELAEFFGEDTIAFAVTFVFVDAYGEPTDVDTDGYLDTALSEIYFNAGFDWSLSGEEGKVDFETTALHELGHALGLGHMGSPPEGAMNPVYAGVRHDLQKIDHAGLCLVNGRR